jgi:hypothetical protein
MPPFQFFEAITSGRVEATYQCSAAKRSNEGIIATPAARKIYDEQSSRIGHYAVQHASEEIAYVWNTLVTPRIRRRVNKAALTCTCTHMDQFGIPCRQLI